MKIPLLCENASSQNWKQGCFFIAQVKLKFWEITWFSKDSESLRDKAALKIFFHPDLLQTSVLLGEGQTAKSASCHADPTKNF